MGRFLGKLTWVTDLIRLRDSCERALGCQVYVEYRRSVGATKVTNRRDESGMGEYDSKSRFNGESEGDWERDEEGGSNGNGNRGVKGTATANASADPRMTVTAKTMTAIVGALAMTAPRPGRRAMADAFAMREQP
jgi:hypothetical protein